MGNAFKAEPSVIIGTLTAFSTAVITLFVAFGTAVSDAQQTAIVAVIAPTVGVIFLMSVVIRQFVYSPKTVERVADTQYKAGVPPVEPQPEIPHPGQV